MTIKEWIDKDLSFYHVTPTRNLPSIYTSGIRSRNGIGICVVRTKNELVVEYICEMMLLEPDVSNFSIIEIKPSTHNIKVNEVIKDKVEELTNVLHNYIVRREIEISKKNIVGTFESSPMGIDLTGFEKKLQDSGILESLD